MDARIASFLTRAEQVQHDRKAAHTLCRAEVRLIEQWRTTDASRKDLLTDYRNALRDKRMTKYFLTAMRLPKVRARQLRVSYDLQVAAKSEDQQPIYHHERLIDKALACLDSRYYSTVLLGLCLLSGRRPIEICMTGDFCEDVNLPEGQVWFAGQAKTRNEEREEQPFAIPLLCDVPRFIDAWDRFRTMKDFTSYDGRRFKSLGKTFGEAYTAHFAPLMPSDTTVRNLRDAYALIAYHTCRPAHPQIAINLYLKQILGHSDSKGQTAQSYQKFYLAAFAKPQWEN
jgi:hypothetical protein